MNPEARPGPALPHPHSEPEQWLPLKKMDSRDLEKGTVRAFLPGSQGNDPREPPRILQGEAGVRSNMSNSHRATWPSYASPQGSASARERPSGQSGLHLACAQRLTQPWFGCTAPRMWIPLPEAHVSKPSLLHPGLCWQCWWKESVFTIKYLTPEAPADFVAPWTHDLSGSLVHE